MIGSMEKLSPDDFRRMQGDVHCLLAAELVPHMIRVLTNRFSDELSRNARDLLAGWDFAMDKESVPACIYEVTYRKLMDCVFMDELGEALFRRYIHISSFPPRAIRMMMRQGNSAWFDDVRTSEKEGMDEVLAESLRRAFFELKELMGGDMSQWNWGRIHTLAFEHVLARKKPLHLIFNLGPYPVSGSALTVDKKQYDYAKPYQANHGVSLRMIVDFSNLKRALHLLPTGESGHLASPHHKDQVPLYLSGRYRTAWLERADVEAHMGEKLLLKQTRP
jgi:penicillin amidase